MTAAGEIKADQDETRLTASFQINAVLYGDEPQGEDTREADHSAAQQREHPWSVNEEPVEVVPRPRRVQPLVNIVQDVEHVRAVAVDARVRHRGRHVCCRALRRASCQNRVRHTRFATANTRSSLLMARNPARIAFRRRRWPVSLRDTERERDGERSLLVVDNLAAFALQQQRVLLVGTGTARTLRGRRCYQDDVLEAACRCLDYAQVERRSLQYIGPVVNMDIRPRVAHSSGGVALCYIACVAMSMPRQRPPSDRLAYTED